MAKVRPPTPAAPTGVVATATSQTRIALTWAVVDQATSYEVSRATVSGGPYGPAQLVTTNSYANNGRTPGMTYYYVVRAVNQFGSSANSTQVSATTPVALVPPASVTATPVAATRVQVDWSAVAGATGYEVWHSTVSGGPYTKKATVGGTSYLHTAATPDATQYYVVRTVGPSGISGNSTQATVTTPALPAPPGNVAAAPVSPTSVAVSWDPVTGATVYEVWRSNATGGPYVKKKTVAATTATDTTATPGTTYFYIVRTVSATGTSPDSAEASATTP